MWIRNRRILPAIIACWLLCVAGFAQGQNAPVLVNETTLNGVTIGTTFLEVLAARGAPHHVGPAQASVADVMALLTSSGPTLTGAVAGVGDVASTVGAVVGSGVAALKVVEPAMVWLYDGNGKNGPTKGAAFSTTVFFDDRGVVIGVAVLLNDFKATPQISTESGITFGTRMTDIVKKYDWPTPFARIGSYLFCPYQRWNVAFALDGASRKVVCMSIGLPVAIIAPPPGAAGGVVINLPGGAAGSVTIPLPPANYPAMGRR